MILLLTAISLVILGVVSLIVYCKKPVFEGEFWGGLSIVGLLLGGVALFIMIIFLATKPYDYKRFKVEYDTIKETLTEKDDIRDATFTNKIIEINQEIRTCREFENSKWIGIFHNKKICRLELLKKG